MKIGRMFLISISIILSVIGLTLFIIFLLKVGQTHRFPLNNAIDLQNSGQFGDYVGGVIGTIFSLAGVLLLFLTLKEQRTNFHRERAENNYFEMIKFHRENILEMEFHMRWKHKDDDRLVDVSKGRKVFKDVFRQFSDAYRELSFLFDNVVETEIYEQSYIEELLKLETIKEREIALKQFAKIDIIYSIVFFGLSKEGISSILSILADKYKRDFILKLTSYASFKPATDSKYWNSWKLIDALKDDQRIIIWTEFYRKRTESDYKCLIDELSLKADFISQYYSDDYKKYYGGHQFRLGHYFRHLYHTVHYINKDETFTYAEKYDYIKILRAQLSTYEQKVFFVNSLCQLGRSWEIEKKFPDSKKVKLNDQLITKYDLIKNIPENQIVHDIKLDTYYPLVSFETFKIKNAEEKKKILFKLFT